MADRILAREVAAIRRLKKRATSHGKRFVADLIEIGMRLQRVKARVGHGNWTKWLQKNFHMSADSASNYMRLHDLSQTSEFPKLRNLPLDLLYWLAREDAEIRKTVAARAEAGEVVIRRTVATVHAKREAPALPTRTLVLSRESEPTPEAFDVSQSDDGPVAPRTFAQHDDEPPQRHDDEPPQRPSLGPAEIHAGLIKWFVKSFSEFARELKRSPDPEDVVTALTAKERLAIREDADAVMAYMADLIQCIERPKARPHLSVITDGTGDDENPEATEGAR